LALFIAVIFIIDQIILGVSGFLILNILIATVVFVGVRDNLSRLLVVSFSLGFLADLTALRIFPTMTVYLLSIAVLADQMRRRYIEFSSVVAITIVVAILSITYVVLFTLVYERTLTIVNLYSVLANIGLGTMMVFLLRKFFKRGAGG